ncbi:MAG: hypothetical protein Q4B85_08450 [Lachnospiraceae bacterium]|nr:hypothetical protein [Lachnospiraceae bacterium]
MEKKYKIGAFCFSITCPENMPIPDTMQVFEREDILPEYHYSIELAKVLKQPEGTLLQKRQDLLVYQNEGREERLIGVKGMEGYYALYQEISEQNARVCVLESELGQYNLAPFFTSLLALERHMLQRESLVLHCAYVACQGKAILFSAPSETGKTTQAMLWEKYMGTEQINGDRALLHKEDGIWQAGGWPVCGTSEYCSDQTMPVHAIVMLSQAKENHAERMRPMKAFSSVYSQITINRWNNEAHNRAMSLIEELVTEVPVVHLACDISKEAVICLAEMIL